MLKCRSCRAQIARIRDGVEVDGAHAHRFVNPSYIVFNIRCFDDVRSVLVRGPASAEWSWFQGFLWRVAICSNCGLHLGWRYERGGEFFYGLIAEQLTED